MLIQMQIYQILFNILSSIKFHQTLGLLKHFVVTLFQVGFLSEAYFTDPVLS